MNPLRVWIGYDPREDEAYRVCKASIERHTSVPVDIRLLRLDELREAGLYTRATQVAENGQLWDVLSGAPMSTEFSLSRFLVPHLADYYGQALFVDCDFLFRRDINDLFLCASGNYAVQVVKHCHVPREFVKMDGRHQVRYERKNWSSLMLWNCGHPAAWLSPQRFNELRGSYLHRFEWIPDEYIGELAGDWNWLALTEPSAVHFTEGVPTMPGYQHVPFADEYRYYLSRLDEKAPIAMASTTKVIVGAGQK
jgi:hypothetical protein